MENEQKISPDIPQKKNHEKRTLIFNSIKILVLLLVVLFVLGVAAIVIIIEVSGQDLKKSDDNVYRNVNVDLRKLKFGDNYKLLKKEVSKTPGVFGYYTDIKIAYQNLSTKAPSEIQNDIETSFVQAGCKSSKKSGYNYDYAREQSNASNSLLSQRNIELAVKPKKILDSEAQTGIPYICSQPEISYFFEKNIDSQADFSKDDEDYNPSEIDVSGVDYQTIDFSKQRVDKFIILGSYT